MTQELFLDDSYIKECESTVVSVGDGKHVILNCTVFYPKGGGQLWDTGKMVCDDESYDVLSVERVSGEVYHEVDKLGLSEGKRVHCALNWQRRYRLMRGHTAAHVFISLLCSGTGALVTGNQIDEDQIRIDFSLEKFDRQILQKYIDETNEFLAKDIPVRSYYLSREDALKIPTIVRTAGVLPPNIPLLRIVEIEGIDRQADGGTHVRNLREVGKISLLKADNKGKNNRRVYFVIEP